MLNLICRFLLLILVVIVGTDAVVRTIKVGPDSIQKDFDFAVDGDVFSFVWSADVKTPVRVYEVNNNQSCAIMSKGSEYAQRIFRELSRNDLKALCLKLLIVVNNRLDSNVNNSY